ncbi:MAG TPA: right-handed parallel beta-helix repeat-containing protein [Pseudonocardiaceae bacterium]|nr:right-handed parallel beta-helix repeat-containing protein [Pseudonocardiaceae bacterium]
MRVVLGGRTFAVLAVALFGLLWAAPPGWAHEERPVLPPDGSGSVPSHRTGEPDLLVCKADRADFERRIAGFPAQLRERNRQLFERCLAEGFRHLQEAVDRVDGPGRTIAILPGLYQEEPSLAEPAGGCADLDAPRAKLGHQILSLDQQRRCPHNQNLVAIIGIEGLQIEGTGAQPLDVIVDAQYRRLNAIRADGSDGIYLRNFTAQRTTFNSVYVLGTDGFVIDRMLTRWNDEYGFLTFATDHGLYTDCESYGNGDSGIYPGSASDLNRDKGYDVPRYSIEIRNCRSHQNMVGYSGTAGDSVWAHDNEFFDNMAGASMDSAFPNHPGLPQNHAKFERNIIRDNNKDYYAHVRDGTCARPTAERGYERGVVCPAVGLPRGTGIITAGGNDNVYRDNWIYGHDNAAFGLFAVPAFLRNESDPGRQFDTSHRNRYAGNHLGRSPTGESRPNGADVWWDGQGSGNCWQHDAERSTPAVLPECGAVAGEVSGGGHRVLGEPVKLVKLYACSGYDLGRAHLPGSCDWFGASGLGRIEVQLALVTSALLALAGLLLWRRLRGSRAGLAFTIAGLAGLALDVVAATDAFSPWPPVALVLMGVWWVGIGLLLRRERPALGAFTVVVGALAFVDAFDKAVMLVPLLPVGPAWIRGIAVNIWFFWALASLAARSAPAPAEPRAVPAGAPA